MPDTASQRATLRLKPRAWIGVAVFFAYAAWVLGVWLARDIDYLSVSTEANLVQAVLQPLSVAALALAGFLAWSGWWRAALFDAPRLRHPVYLALLLAAMLGMISFNLAQTDWGLITARHLAVLVASALLIGFCEEMVTRGVLLVSLRGEGRTEMQAWFWSSALFGLLHATNAFFGLGVLALAQVLLAFCMGTGFYLLRRLGGTLLLPMLAHAAWDFSSFTAQLSGAGTPPAKIALMIVTYMLPLLLLAFIALRQARRDAGV